MSLSYTATTTNSTMWARLSGKRKALQKQDSHSQETSKVLERHPSVSFDSTPQSHFASPSPPLSPSRHSSEIQQPGTCVDNLYQNGALFTRLASSNKLAPTLNATKGFEGQCSSNFSDITNPAFAHSPTSDQTTFVSVDPSTNFPRSAHVTGYATPVTRPTTPNTNQAANCVRSILRNPRTPGTGQNVRFFSRDAFRVISPNSSIASAYEDCESASILDKPNDSGLSSGQLSPADLSRNQDVGANSRVSSTEISQGPSVFSPPLQRMPSVSNSQIDAHASSHAQRSSSDLASPRLSHSSLLLPIPPPDFSNLFDISDGHDVPNIPEGSRPQMADGAVELIGEEDDDGRLTSTLFKKEDTIREEPATVNDDFFTMNRSSSDEPLQRSDIIEGEETMFLSMGRTSPKSLDLLNAQDARGSPTSRTSRSVRMIGHLSIQSSSQPQKISKRKDFAFKAHQHTCDAPPKDEDRVSTDYGQSNLAGAEMSAADATKYYTPPRDSSTRLVASCDSYYTRRKTKGADRTRYFSVEDDLISNLRDQLSLQQDMCAQYEIDIHARDELVDLLSSRLEKTEASGQRRKGAMRSWRKRAESLERACKQLQEEMDNSRQDSLERSVMDDASKEALRVLHVRIGELERERAEWKKKEHKLKEKVDRLEDEVKEERDNEGSYTDREQDETAWATERAELLSRIEQLQGSSKELDILKAELEAQWKHMENATDQIECLEKEKKNLQQIVLGLEDRIGVMEVEWNENENGKAVIESESYKARECAERDRDEIHRQLQSELERTQSLTVTLQERTDQLTTLQETHAYTLEHVARLESQHRSCVAELASYPERLSERDKALESLREELSTTRREHARTVECQARELQDVIQRDAATRADVEAWARDKTDNDALLAALREENERWKKQVHELQQESADKEVRIVQLAKQRAQDREDLAGMNIALDSKQQELELLKRRLGVRGTAGSTPAITTKYNQRLQRRESVASFASSDVDTAILDQTPFGKSTRVNTSASTRKDVVGAIRESLPPPAPTNRPLFGETPTPKPHRKRMSLSVVRPLRRSTSISSTASASSDHGDSEKENAGFRVESGRKGANMIPILA